MTPEEFEKLPIIGLGDTFNNAPTGYTEIQKLFLPYIDLYHNFLWFCFFGILIYLSTKFILLPLIKGKKQENHE